MAPAAIVALQLAAVPPSLPVPVGFIVLPLEDPLDEPDGEPLDEPVDAGPLPVVVPPLLLPDPPPPLEPWLFEVPLDEVAVPPSSSVPRNCVGALLEQALARARQAPSVPEPTQETTHRFIALLHVPQPGDGSPVRTERHVTMVPRAREDGSPF
jgi:hypothetical protein